MTIEIEERPATGLRSTIPETPWHQVCALEDLDSGWGEAVWLPGRQVALFRLAEGTVHASDQKCPVSGAQVMARGITGSSQRNGDIFPTVASPLHKDVYRLDTGECLTNPQVRLAIHPVRLVDGHVWVGVPA